jgi:hypothetical protein
VACHPCSSHRLLYPWDAVLCLESDLQQIVEGVLPAVDPYGLRMGAVVGVPNSVDHSRRGCIDGKDLLDPSPQQHHPDIHSWGQRHRGIRSAPLVSEPMMVDAHIGQDRSFAMVVVRPLLVPNHHFGDRGMPSDEEENEKKKAYQDGVEEEHGT